LPRVRRPSLKNPLAWLFAPGSARLRAVQREFPLDFLKRMGLERTQVLLELGRGALGAGPLVEYLERGHYLGVDANPGSLEEARQEVRAAGLEHREPRLLPGSEDGSFELPGPVDWVWAFSLLTHAADDVLERVCASVARHLQPGGIFWANARCGAPRAGQAHGQGPPVFVRPLEFFSELGARQGFQVRDLGSLSGLGHVSGDRERDGERMLLWRRPAALREDSRRG
jgi:SAM-dependent methyltransferase